MGAYQRAAATMAEAGVSRDSKVAGVGRHWKGAAELDRPTVGFRPSPQLKCSPTV